jgi:hypothetical protein
VTGAWVSAFKIFIDVMTVAADAIGAPAFYELRAGTAQNLRCNFQFVMGRRPIAAMTAGALLFSVRVSAAPGIKHIAFLH